jgi:hypothetical protein
MLTYRHGGLMKIHPLVWLLIVLMTVQSLSVTPLILTLLKMQGYL